MNRAQGQGAPAVPFCVPSVPLAVVVSCATVPASRQGRQPPHGGVCWRASGAVLLAAAALAGCGGSGGGDDAAVSEATAPNTPTAPTAPAPVSPAALQIATQPQPAAVDDGAAASFTVGVNSASGLAYQWRRNGADIAGATAATLLLPAVALADDGARFVVVVSSGSEVLSSSEVRLTVRARLPQVSAAPQAPAQAPAVGQSATFSVTASGSAPLAYQWQRNGVDIAGATAASYTTAALTAADNGASFAVRVSNSAGSTTSNAALLTVTSPAPVASSDGTRSLFLAETHTLALRSDGLLVGWGQNTNAQLGGGAAIAGSPAVQIATGVASASANFEYGLAVDDAGALRGWGSNSAAWLGGTVSTTYTTPQAVSWPVRAVRQAEALSGFVLMTDGTVWSRSRQVPGLNDVVSLSRDTGVFSGLSASGTAFTGPYAVRADGTAWRLSTERAEVMPGLASVRQVACSNVHCLALLADGTLRAWGEGRSGQLGHGLAASSNTPVVVSGLNNVTHIAAGGSVARTADGKVWSWGSGDLSARPSVRSGVTVLPPPNVSVPVEVTSLAGSTEVACASRHCAARKADGTVWTWGNNLYGQLGTDRLIFGVPIPDSQEPVVVPGVQLNAPGAGTAGTIRPALRLLAVPRPGWASEGQTLSFHASAVGQGSAITYQWLRNGAVIAGATSAAYSTPALVAADDGARYSVRVSDGTETLTSAEATISVSTATASLWPAATYTLALRRDGGLLGWGSNANSQLGSGAAVAGSAARLVASGMTRSSAAPRFGLSVDAQGGLWGWGADSDVWLGGAVPTSGAVPVTTPVAVPWPARRVRQAEGLLAPNSSTFQYSFMLLADGTVWQLPGDRVTSGTTALHTAVQVPGLYDITALAQGHGRQQHAVRSDGSVFALGGSFSSSEPRYFSPSATPVAGLANARRVSCGTDHCLALLADGTLRAWGQGTRGQLGQGAAANSSVPVVVAGLGNVTHIAVTSFHGASLARTADGKVWSWGAGELSARVRAGTTDGAPADATQPVEVPSLAGSTELACSTSHCVARLGDGSLRAWGANGSGQLGVAASAGDFRQAPLVVPGVALN